MGRPLRLELADACYHVLSRGNERRAIFFDDADRQRFVALLGLMAERFDLEVWAYVLMPNHYHLVLRTRRPNLSRAMQWLGVAYTNGVNARHGRSGHLFQGRFKAFVAEDETYLARLLLYVHRNPLRAGLVERLADYPWSSYRWLAYRRKGPKWFRPELALGLFGGRPETFRRRVRAYSEEDDRLLEDLWHGTFLGSREGLERLVRRLGLRRDREKPQTRAVLRTARGTSAREAAARWAGVLGIGADELAALRRATRRVCRPRRDLLMHLLWRGSAVSLSDIGAYFNVGYSAVSMACRRAEEHLRRDRRLRRRLRNDGIIDI